MGPTTNRPPRGLVRFPERIGRYQLLLPIASGGMATVFVARAHGPSGFALEVALKLPHEHLRKEPQFTSALIEEAKLAARIRHPHVVPVLDVGDEPGAAFLVMDYVEGDSLSGLGRMAEDAGRELPRRILMRILTDALAGLHAAHELRDEHGELVGLVHRDFSPQNILVGLDGVAKLTDFGVAKAATRVGRTRTGLIKGKTGYLSPEQLSRAPLDRRSDIWAAGIIAWEFLAARPLFSDNTDVSTLMRLVKEAPPRLREVAPLVPADLDAIVARALSPDRDKRYQTAAELRRDLVAASRALGELADTDEVAELVTALAGAKLAERGTRVRSIERKRQDAVPRPAAPRPLPRGETLIESTTTDVVPTLEMPTEEAETIVRPGRRAPSLRPGAPGESQGRLSRGRPASLPPPRVSLQDGDDDDVVTSIPKALPSAATDPLLLLHRSVAPPRLADTSPEAPPADHGPGPATSPAPPGPELTPLEQDLMQKHRLRRRIIVVALLVMVAGAVAILVVPRASSGDAAGEARPDASPPSSRGEAPVVVPIPELPAPPPLTVKASTPLLSLRVDGQAVEISKGTRELRLAVDQRDHVVAVEGIATDGRKAKALVAPDVSVVVLEFTAPSTKPRASR